MMRFDKNYHPETQHNKKFQNGGKRSMSGLHGQIYQLKLLMLYLMRGLFLGYDFELTTEDEDAKQFDDLVFVRNVNGRNIFTLLQAKHKENDETKIGFKDLLQIKSKRNKFDIFSLIKYFFSYHNSKWEKRYRNEHLNVIICTNVAVDLSSQYDFQGRLFLLSDVLVANQIPSDRILDFDNELLKQRPMCFKLNANMALILTSKIIRFIEENRNLPYVEQFLRHINSDINDGQLFGYSIKYAVDEYLDRLILATGQPNETELDNILTKHIEGFHVLEKQHVYTYFFEFMLNWLKDNKPKGEKFLTSADGIRLLVAAKLKLSDLSLHHTSNYYVLKLNSFGVHFNSTETQKFTAFLQSTNKLLIVNGKSCVKLTSMKIIQVMQSTAEFNQNFLFLKLNKIKQLRDDVCRAFDKDIRFLVLQSTLDDKLEDFKLMLDELQAILLKCCDKKIILICSNPDSVNLFRNMRKLVLQDETCIGDLSQISQKRILLESIVLLQGKEIKLNTLVKNSYQKNALVKNSNLIDCLKNEILLKLIKNFKPKIGMPIAELGEERNYYVPRFLSLRSKTNIEVREAEFLKLSSKHVILAAAAGMGKSTLITKLIADYKSENPSKLILRINLGKCGSVLRQWTTNKIEITQIKVAQLLYNSMTSLRISDEVEVDSNVSECFELRNGIICIRSDKIAELTSEAYFKIKYFILSYNNRKIWVVLDGFDELFPCYAAKGFEFVGALAKIKFEKLLVITRVHSALKKLTKMLDATVYNLNGFNWTQRNSFLAKFWKTKLKYNDDRLLHLNDELNMKFFHFFAFVDSAFCRLTSLGFGNYKNIFIKLATLSTSDMLQHRKLFAYEDTLLKNPLILRMIGILLAEEFNKYWRSDNTQVEPQQYDRIVEILNIPKFIELVVRQLFFQTGDGKKTNLLETAWMQTLLEEQFEKSMLVHTQLAVFELIKEPQELQLYLTEEQIKDKDNVKDRVITGKEQVGICWADEDGKIRFMHQCFAEYFVAKAKNLVDTPMDIKSADDSLCKNATEENDRCFELSSWLCCCFGF